MTGHLGEVATWGAVAALAAAAVLALRGPAARRAAAVAHRLGAALAAAAVACLAWALATGDFTLAYVAAVSDRSVTWPYRLAGLWAGMAGSLLLWSALLAAHGWRRAGGVERAALAAVAGATLAAGAALASPWRRLAAPALDGEGLAPILDHPAMLVHPPLLYVGLTGLAVPWAATVAALARGRLDTAWARRVRGPLLASLAVLAAGMAIGAHWAYVEVGWGGFWAWDPVENTALLPWLAALAALHLLRAGRRAPAAGAACGALALAVLGTVLTRSGSAPSVHAFAEDPDVGRALWAVAAAAVAAPVVAWRLRPLAAGPGDRAGGDGGDRSERGREARARALGTAAAAGAAVVLVVVLAGTLRPLVGDAAVAVEGAFYSRLAGPVAVAGAAALVAGGLVHRPWRRPSHLAHLGFLVLLAGVLGSTAGSSATATLAPGETLAVGGWEVRNDGVSVATRGGRDAVVADVALLRGGEVRARLAPSVVAHRDRARLLPETSLRSTPLGDVLVALRGADDGGRALLEAHARPLVWWVWWGAGLLVAGVAWSWASARYPVTATAAEQRAASSSRSASPRAA